MQWCWMDECGQYWLVDDLGQQCLQVEYEVEVFEFKGWIMVFVYCLVLVVFVMFMIVQVDVDCQLQCLSQQESDYYDVVWIWYDVLGICQDWCGDQE